MKIELKKQPLYKIGDIVVVVSETDKEKAIMGKVVSADCKISEPTNGRWFYIVEADNLGRPERVCLYEEDIIQKLL